MSDIAVVVVAVATTKLPAAIIQGSERRAFSASLQDMHTPVSASAAKG